MTIFREVGRMQPPDPDMNGALAELWAPDVVDPVTDVALVDDDPVLMALVKRVLWRQGYSFTWFADGISAVAALCRPTTCLKAKLILLDVSMPGLGGFDVLDLLHRDGVLNQARVIMLTASASEQDVRQAIGLGATGYLAKPLDISVLLDRVQHALHPTLG